MSDSTAWRPQPPSIEDPERGNATLQYLGQESEVTGVSFNDTTEESKQSVDWSKRARDAFRFSTTYVDSNYRKQWDDSIRAFNNLHSGDSKYNSELYRKRSNLFRPKTRAIIRKNEAAAAAAFFSNSDLIDVTATNQSDKSELVSAEVTKQLLQYRLSKSIPWFQVCIGAVQDGQVQGAVAAHVHWRFYEKHDEDGETESLDDRPVIDLIPIENIRIDPSSDWTDPIGTSPYVIHLIPMFWCDVKQKMAYDNPKGQRWKKITPQEAFGSSYGGSDDSTRQARNNVSQDPTQQKRDISDYDIVWIHRHIHRFEGEDWEFYTLASEKMLTDPEPLKNTTWHGKRPYVMGKVMIETHKVLTTPLPILVKPLQEEANDLQNQRMDNVRLVLNKRWFAKRGKNVDLASLVRNVPGGITLLDDVEADVKEITWPDVTQSAYLEQDRVDGDFSDLVGNFNPMQVQAQRTGRESTNTMRMLQGPTNLLTEYMLKTFVETFVQPVLRLVMLLEQHYESNLTLISLAGQKAQVFKRFGVQHLTDAVLDNELNISVNVGMGSTDPAQKIQRFVYALQSYAQICKMPPAGLDLSEVWKELSGLSGYQDGERFKIDGQNPEVMRLQQQIQLLTKELLKGPAAKAEATKEATQAKVVIARENNDTKLKVAAVTHVYTQHEKTHEHKLEMVKEQFGHQAQQELQAQGAEHQMAQADRGAEHQLHQQGEGFQQQRVLAHDTAQYGEASEQRKLQHEGSQKQEKDSSSDKKIEALVKGQEDLAKSIAELAKAISQGDGKPRKRKGKAKLPSGGMMEFEMEDS